MKEKASLGGNQLAMSRRLLLCLVAGLTAFSLSGCGGGSSGGSGSGSSQPEPDTAVSGLVTDPEIEGAAVRLVDADGDALSRIFRTSADGRFRFELTISQLAALEEIVSVGGRDAQTGADLTGITLRAPANDAGDFVVSPVTTLWLEASDELSDNQIADLLGLSSSEMLDDDPADNPEVQALALKITEIAAALRDVGLGWGELVDELQATNGDFALAAEQLAEDSASPLMAVANRIRLLDSGVNPDGVSTVQRWNLLRIEEGLRAYYQDDLGVTLVGDEADAITRIAQAAWEGAERKGVAPNSPGILNLARYLVTVYGLDASSLTADLAVPSDITSDDLVAFVISTDFIDHQLPLAQGERLTDDNAKRAEYFLSSDLSPFYRAEQLFTGVSDDLVTDPVYAEIAAGLASAGLLDRAELTVRSKIFQPRERAEAFRRVGAVMIASGNTERGVELLDVAAAIYNGPDGIIESVGPTNLTPKDANFLQDLTSDYLSAAQIEKADAALAPLDALREALAGGAYFTYQPIASALKNQALAALEVAEDSGLQGSDYQRAEVYIDTAAEWVDGFPLFPVPVPGLCRLQQTLETASYADLYSRLGDRGKTLAALDKFEALVQLECNSSAAGYVEVAAPAYTRLGEVQRLEAFLNDVVVPIQLNVSPATSKATVQPLIAIGAAQAAAKNGNSALEAFNARFNGPDVQELGLGAVSKVFHMVKGIAALNYDSDPLFARLLADGHPEDAAEIVNAAWALSSSSVFVSATTSPEELIAEGCRAVVLATKDIGDMPLALERMDTCANLAANEYGAGSATKDRIDALIQVAAGYLALNHYPAVEINAAKGQIAVLGDPQSRLAAYLDLASQQAQGGRLAEALATLDLEVTSTLSDLAPATDVDMAKALVGEIVDVAKAYLSLIKVTRGLLATEGLWEPASVEHIAEARNRVRELIEGRGDSPLPFDSALSVLELVDQNGQLELIYDEYQPNNSLLGILNAARHYELAETLARNTANPAPNVNKMLNAIASALAEQDDYPGTRLARFDFDGDGLADFFDPQSTEAERQNAPFSMDDDIDNDGIQDAIDSTPYCATCG